MQPWPPEARPTKVCRGIPFVTPEGKGSQAWGIHYGDTLPTSSA